MQLQITIKAMTTLVGRLSLSVGWENGPERRLKIVSFNSYLPVILRRLIWVCTICQCLSSGFTDNPLYAALCRHSDKNSAATNNRYLDFVQTRGLISLDSDNHVDNNLKEIFVSVYYGSIVNNRPKNVFCSTLGPLPHL